MHWIETYWKAYFHSLQYIERKTQMFKFMILILWIFIFHLLISFLFYINQQIFIIPMTYEFYRFELYLGYKFQVDFNIIFLKINIVYYYGKRALIYCVFQGLNPLLIEITRSCLDSKFSLVFKYISGLAFYAWKNLQKQPFIKIVCVFICFF